MVPKIAARGRSFKGVHLYVFHDKNQAKTAERLAWWHVENLPTNDPERTWCLMAHTALHADALRKEAGGKSTGRKAEKPVFWFSLSWHEEQQPEREHMISTGRSALAALGLQEHQAVMVAHSDGVPHIHVIANAIHPQTGLSHTPTYSKLALSKWAQAYELEHGKIYCEERVANNAQRAKGEGVKHHDRKLITRLYKEAQNAQDFKAALEQYGYQLAQGNKLLLINREGLAISLAKQIEDAEERELRTYLQHVELRKISEAGNRKARQREEDEAARRKREDEEKTGQKGKRQRSARQAAPGLNKAANPAQPAAVPNTHAVRRSALPEGYNGLPLPQTVLRLEQQQREEVEAFYETNRVIRERWQWQLGTQREQEQAERLRGQIAAYEKQREGLPAAPSRWSGARGQVKEVEERLTELRSHLAILEEREAQRRHRDEQEAREHLKGLQGIQERQQRERQELHSNPKALLGAEGRTFNQRSAPERRPRVVQESERPLAQVPVTLQARIEDHATQAQQARALAAAQTAATNDNRRPAQQAFNSAAQPHPQPAKDAFANDNRRAGAQKFNRAAQAQQEEPTLQATPADRLADEQQQFMQALQSYGISEADAQRLSTEKADACRAKIPTIPTLLETQDTWNSAGYVRAFIERDDWEAPATPREPQPQPVAQAQPEQGRPQAEGRAARATLSDQWQAVQDGPQRQAQPRPQAALVRSQEAQAYEEAGSQTTEEDEQVYALLDQWKAQQSQQQVREAEEQAAESTWSGGEYSAQDVECHALLDSWAQAQERGLERGPVLDR